MLLAALADERRLRRAFAKERERNVLAVMLVNLDGFLLSGKAKPVLSRLAADFTGWERD